MEHDLSTYNFFFVIIIQVKKLIRGSLMKVVDKAKTKTGSEGQLPFFFNFFSQSIAIFTIATKIVSIRAIQSTVSANYFASSEILCSILKKKSPG